MSDDRQVKGYLRRVRAALCLPRAQRRRAVEEIRNHLDDGVAAHMREGAPREHAVSLAIAELGRPDTVAAEFRGLRAILYRAIREGRFPQEKNPFFQFRVREVPAELRSAPPPPPADQRESRA